MTNAHIELWSDGVDLYASEQLPEGSWADDIITPIDGQRPMEHCRHCDMANYEDYERCMCCGERAA